MSRNNKPVILADGSTLMAEFVTNTLIGLYNDDGINGHDLINMIEDGKFDSFSCLSGSVDVVTENNKVIDMSTVIKTHGCHYYRISFRKKTHEDELNEEIDKLNEKNYELESENSDLKETISESHDYVEVAKILLGEDV